MRNDEIELLGFTRRPNQSILKEIKPEYSLEGLMLKLTRPGWAGRPELTFARGPLVRGGTETSQQWSLKALGWG